MSLSPTTLMISWCFQNHIMIIKNTLDGFIYNLIITFET